MTDAPHRKVFLALPATTGQHGTANLVSVVNAVLEATDLGMEVDLRCWDFDSLAPHARNALLGQFLQSDCTDLFWVDHDISWPRGAFAKLLSYPVDFVAGAYRTKREQVHFPIRWLPKPELWADPETGLLEVESVPTGFCRMSRAVLERLLETHRDKAYHNPSCPDVPCYWIFDVPFEAELGPIGEDFSICRKWRALGGQVWVDPDIEISHAGAKEYTGCLGDWLRTRMAVAEAMSSPVYDKLFADALGDEPAAA